MPGPKAPPISLAPDERQGLAGLIRAHKTPQHLSFRAQIILQLADGQNTREVADGLRHQPSHSEAVAGRHWLAHPAASVLERWQDAPRPGTPATFSPEQWCVRSWPLPVSPLRQRGGPSVTGLRARSPMRRSNGGLSRRFLSAMSGVFYNQAELQPPRSRYWLNAEPDEAADKKMAEAALSSSEAPAQRGRTCDVDR